MQNKRIATIDITRGIIMIIMALDHVRDFMHSKSLTQNPVNLDTTTPALFATRWITHICAPGFVFLAGTSVFLQLQRSKDVAATRKFLITRGLWLVVLELTLVNFSFWFDLQFRTIILEVISAIGLGFLLLAALLKISPRAALVTGIFILVLQGLVPLIPISEGSVAKTMVDFLFLPGGTMLTTQLLFIKSYPVIPWFGIMLCGFAAGVLFSKEASERSRSFLRIAGILAISFVVLRLLNVYGDPAPWAKQTRPVYTIISFFNISKYPPSLLFSLATLSVICLLLAFSDRLSAGAKRIAATYGSVPLFYFVIHLYLIHLLTLVMVVLQGYSWNDMVFANMQFGRPSGHSGVPLAIIYLIWLAVVAALYPLCRWYSSYKKAHPGKIWLRYL